ncbi:enoyl-CoA hydratase [Nakamurella sp. YIM 132087]|uniref:Enoyl-CoA hydratase n=1 Tax=Nakamurella alba TaxID=2665158 RepID=A0A7K1FJW2_9ACTN|nr:enoyl-CoA hydratase [Nakamurella alba]
MRATVEDGRWTITLDDPDRRNAIDEAVIEQLGAAVDAVAADPSARTLVVTGAGAAFCAGADLPALFGDTDRTVAQTRDHLHRVYESFLRIRRLPIPTLAAVQGPAVGAGMNLALACDVRIAGPRARFAATFTRIGLHPGGGCTWFLVDILGPQRAFAMIMDGGALDGPEAVAAGLALRVVDDPVADAQATAARWAAMDPQLARDVKKAVGIARSGGFDAALEFESWAQASAAGKPEIQAVVDTFRR